MSDEIVWQVINQQFCAYKVKTDKGQTFCRNEYNVTGSCSRQSCPLANSKYATVKSENGRSYLYIRTVERAHTPAKWWEKIRSSKNYSKALKQIDDHSSYWNKFSIHKCKQRFTKSTQVAITERRSAMREMERHYVGVAPKVKRREENRERKALAAAKIEKSIEKELLDRLKSGAYGDKPMNVDEKIWKKVMGHLKDENDQEEEEDWESEEEEESDEGEVEYVEDDGEAEFVDMEDLEQWLGDGNGDHSDSDDSDEESSDDDENTPKRKKAKLSRRPKIEIEYEEERAHQELPQEAAH